MWKMRCVRDFRGDDLRTHVVLSQLCCCCISWYLGVSSSMRWLSSLMEVATPEVTLSTELVDSRLTWKRSGGGVNLLWDKNEPLPAPSGHEQGWHMVWMRKLSPLGVPRHLFVASWLGTLPLVGLKERQQWASWFSSTKYEGNRSERKNGSEGWVRAGLDKVYPPFGFFLFLFSELRGVPPAGPSYPRGIPLGSEGP